MNCLICNYINCGIIINCPHLCKSKDCYEILGLPPHSKNVCMNNTNLMNSEELHNFLAKYDFINNYNIILFFREIHMKLYELNRKIKSSSYETEIMEINQCRMSIENKKLREQNVQYIEEIDEITHNYKKLTEENNDNRQKYENERIKKNELISKIMEFRKDEIFIQKLNNEITLLREKLKNEINENENTKIKKEESEKETMIIKKDLEEKNDKLEIKNKLLEFTNIELKDEINELNNDIKLLNEENNSLKQSLKISIENENIKNITIENLLLKIKNYEETHKIKKRRKNLYK